MPYKFSHYKTWIYSFTVFYNTLKRNRIILYHFISATWWTNSIYIFQNTPSIVSACCIEFNYYKMRIYSFTVFYNTHKHNRIILYHIWYLLHDEPTVYIYSRTLQVLFQHAALNLITTKWEFTLLQYSKTLLSIIASFCIIFDICNMINYRFIYIPEYSQYSYQHAVINLVTTRSVFTLLQYSKTLSSIIASFCIIFDICYMMNQQYYIYSRILPVLISTCCIKFNHYKTCIYSITVYYNTLKHNRIILYHIWYLLHDEPTVYIYSRTLQVLFQHAALNLITTKWEFTLLQYSTTLSSIIASFCIIFDICYMMNQQCYIYSRILPVFISACRNKFSHYKKCIYSITVF